MTTTTTGRTDGWTLPNELSPYYAADNYHIIF